jgi:hypothetical protein
MVFFTPCSRKLVGKYLELVSNGLVGLLSSEKVAFLRLTGVSGRGNSMEMKVRSDILET